MKRSPKASSEHDLLPFEQCASEQLPNRIPNIRPRHDRDRPLLPLAVPGKPLVSMTCNQTAVQHLPVQGYRHGAQPSAQHGANQAAIDLIHGQQQGHNLSPCLPVHAMYVYQGKRAEQRNVGAAEQRVEVVRGHGRAEEDEGPSEEGRCGECGEQEGEEGGLSQVVSIAQAL
jgi:hypothetical protein